MEAGGIDPGNFSDVVDWWFSMFPTESYDRGVRYSVRIPGPPPFEMGGLRTYYREYITLPYNEAAFVNHIYYQLIPINELAFGENVSSTELMDRKGDIIASRDLLVQLVNQHNVQHPERLIKKEDIANLIRIFRNRG